MSTVSVNVGQELIEPIITAKIQAAIVEAMSKESGLVERTVTAALMQPVEKERYSNKKVPWLEIVCEKVIREAAEKAIQEWAASHKDQITACFLKTLQSKKEASKLVKAMVDGLTGVVANHWKFSVQIGDK